MARISTYALDASINDADKLIGTDADNNNQTKNFSLLGIADYVIDKLIDPDATDFHIPVFNQDGVRITDSIMHQDSSVSNGTAGTQITIDGNLLVNQNATVYLDLSVTGESYLLGNVYLGTTQSDTIKQRGTLELLAQIKDSSGTLGNNEQVLVSDALGKLHWENYQGTGLEYQSAWDPANNTPDLTAIPLTGDNTGKYWVASVEGNTDLGGITDWNPGDWAIVSQDNDDNVFWDKIDNSGIDGSGTTNKLAKWTSSTTLGDSIVSESGTTLTIAGQLNVDAEATFDNSITVTGDSILNGNVILGNESTDIITQTGTLYLNGPIKDTTDSLGGADQILVSNASGELAFTDLADITTGSAEVVEVPVKNLQGSALTKGDPVYISGSAGASGRLEVQLADASDAAKMPALGLLKQDLGINEEGFAVVTGKLRNLPTSPIDGQTPLPNDVIYVKANGTTGAALTLTKPTGASLIQNMGKVGRVSTSSDGTFVVSSILRTNDIPNLSPGKIWVGSTGNTIESGFVTLDEGATKLNVDGDVKIAGERLEFNSTNDVEHIFSIVPATSSAGLGSSSLKFGKSNSATKGGGIAMGQNLISTGDQSQAFGFGSNASGNQSAVFGVNTTATGDQAFAIGNTTNATSGRAFAGGFNTAASGLNSVALGNATVASGTNAVAMGAMSTASGFNCFSLGLGLINDRNASFAIGAYNLAAAAGQTGYKFSVGIGTSTSNRANAMAVNESGYMILDALKNSSSYSSDTAAAAGGVPLGALYRDGNTVKIRLT